jgi:SMC interacting uncharacterized protein involved in chromosome segregation
MEPLKHEINQLTNENNRLHRSLIEAADKADEREKASQSAFRKYKQEIEDLKFLNTQLSSKAKEQEKIVSSERTRLEQILSLIGAGASKDIDGNDYLF